MVQNISVSGQVGISGKISMGPSADFRYWRLETQGIGSSANGNSISELKMTYDGGSNLLDSFTLTNLGGAFSASVIGNINDTIATEDNLNFGYVPSANGNLDFYVDFGDGNKKEVSVYSIAPQGNLGLETVFHTPLEFNAYKSDNAVDWTLVKSFTSISTGFGNWTPGSFRDFDLTT